MNSLPIKLLTKHRVCRSSSFPLRLSPDMIPMAKASRGLSTLIQRAVRTSAVVLLSASLSHGLSAQTADNVVLVTLDGLRWQEVFHGFDPELVAHPDYTDEKRRQILIDRFDADNAESKAARLMPFLHGEIVQHGAIVGDRRAGSCARVTNPWYFSYPGYNEILTGAGDPGINSNDPRPNPNVSFFEWLKNQPGFVGKMAAFTSWDVFPAIFNSDRSGIPVNTGPMMLPDDHHQDIVYRLHNDIPSPWPTVRFDAFTHHYALTYLKREKPRLLYISYGETDDFAHDGHYDQYLLAANRVDAYLKELWDFIQSDEQYRDRTVMFITVDHGRGEQPLEAWRHHGSMRSVANYMQQAETEEQRDALFQYQGGILGSEAVWMAAIGAGIADKGLVNTGESCIGSNQIAATLLSLLGYAPEAFNPAAGKVIEEFLDP
jgi:hypothetical protein